MQNGLVSISTNSLAPPIDGVEHLPTILDSLCQRNEWRWSMNEAVVYRWSTLLNYYRSTAVTGEMVWNRRHGSRAWTEQVDQLELPEAT